MSTYSAATQTLNAFQKSLYAFHRETVLGRLAIDGSKPGEMGSYRQSVADNSVDPYRQRVLDILATYENDGTYYWGPGALSSIVAIDWGGPIGPGTAATNGVTVADCILPRLHILASDGEEIEGGGNRPLLFDFDYVYEPGEGSTDDRWLLEEVRTTETHCNPYETFRRTDGEFEDSIITSNQDAEAVRAVHTKFMTDSFGGVDERVHGREATLENAKETAIRDALETIEFLANMSESQGGFIDGTAYESNIIAIEVNGTEARVLDCSFDHVAIFGPEGEVLLPTGTAHELRQTFLTKIDGQWFVEFIYNTGDVPCDPADFS